MSPTVPATPPARQSPPDRGTKPAFARALLFVSPLVLATILEATGFLRNLPLVFQSVLILTNLGLLGVLWFFTQRHSENTRRGWIATAAALSAITVAISIWAWTYFTSSPVAFQGVLEFLYLGGAVLLWPAMILLRQADKRRRQFNIRTAIDVFVTVVAVATLAWYFILEPNTTNQLGAALFGSPFISPILQIIMLSVAAYTFLQTSSRQPSHLYATGILLLIGADLGLTFILQEITPINLTTPLIWTAGMMALFIDIQRKPVFPAQADSSPLPTANGVPYVMATLAIATLLLGDDLLGLNRIADSEAYLIGLGLLALLLIRQVLSLQDNQRLIRQLVLTNQELYREAMTDHLTGLLNRSAFTTRLHEFVEGEIPGTLLFIDVNDFKQVNDTYGHAAGDALLQSVANRVTHRLEPDWIASRAGGDEFMVALPHASPEIALHFAKELQAALQQPHFVSPEQSVCVTVAIGAAHYPEDGQQLDDVINFADQRMYEMKRSMKAAALTT